MFTPNETTERFDRNIFTGLGRELRIAGKNVPLMMYHATDMIVGVLNDAHDVLVYDKFQRGQWIPIEIIEDGHSYCGWVDTNLIQAK